ncbi:MAG: T9SS type A sorting domain-containing protein [Lewinellaceae bacterium]|nr:T9SS type A sorting domain-containing protein [Lewinellaceae bacterium]
MQRKLLPATPQNIPATLHKLGSGTAWVDFQDPPVPTLTILAVKNICTTVCDTFIQFIQNIELCLGDTISIGGVSYTQPGTVFDTIPAVGSECDTLVTYQLQFIQSSFLNIQCPANITVQAAVGASVAVVHYNNPTAMTDCPCGDVEIELQQGLASGSNLPLGVTQVCLEASNNCGATSACCLSITVQPSPQELACDVKITPCVKFEILGISQNSDAQKTYRMRVTNTCANKLIYTAFQLPNGIKADNPANNTLYTAPSGRQYDVRNPNASPMHSIRFKALGDGIANGQSDIFEYTLPPQASPLFINAMARLSPNLTYEAHLNVFDCVVQQNAKPHPGGATERQAVDIVQQKSMVIFPNPASDILYVQMPEGPNQQVQIRILDTYGRSQFDQNTTSETNLLKLELPTELPSGFYFVEVVGTFGARYLARFVRTNKR